MAHSRDKVLNADHDPNYGNKLLLVTKNTEGVPVFGRLVNNELCLTLDATQAKVFDNMEHVNKFSPDLLSTGFTPERVSEYMTELYIIKLREGLGMPFIVSHRKWVANSTHLPREGYYLDRQEAEDYLQKLKVTLTAYLHQQIMDLRKVQVA